MPVVTIQPKDISMELFERDKNINLLPFDGLVQYHGAIFNPKQSQEIFANLQNSVNWVNDEVTMFGKKIVMSRKMAWFSQQNKDYVYGNSKKIAQVYFPQLVEIQNIVEQISQEKFNACLLNYYHNGKEAMGWHADNEPEIIKNSTIASISLGAERFFEFKHRTKPDKRKLLLQNGSLLLMKNETQNHWLHRLTPDTKSNQPRINLTFRQMV